MMIPKTNDPKIEFLSECKHQVTGLCLGISRMDVHNDKFVVLFLVDMGKVLKSVEEVLEKKKDYMNWTRSNFPHHHARKFQHARQLAEYEEFVIENSALGKNRILEAIRLQEEGDSESCQKLIDEYKFHDTDRDLDGALFKQHVDAIITLHRLQNAGIDFVEFQQAWLIASFNKGSLQVGKATAIKKWLDDQDDAETALDDFILNKLVFPYGKEEEAESSSDRSIDKLIVEILAYEDKGSLDEQEWIQEQKSKIESGNVIRIHNFIKALAEKLEIDLSESNENESNITDEGGAA